MKILKNILAILIVIILVAVYVIDRAILVFAPWIEVPPLQDWLPKSIDPEQIKKEFPTLSDEAIEEISTTRKFTNKLLNTSFVRVAVVAFISMVVYVIWM